MKRNNGGWCEQFEIWCGYIIIAYQYGHADLLKINWKLDYVVEGLTRFSSVRLFG